MQSVTSWRIDADKCHLSCGDPCQPVPQHSSFQIDIVSASIHGAICDVACIPCVAARGAMVHRNGFGELLQLWQLEKMQRREFPRP